MANPDLFWTIFGAVLGAIIMGGSFFWGLMAYSRLEKEGREKDAGGTALIAMILPGVCLLGAGFIALY